MKTLNKFIFERGSAPTVRFKYCINILTDGIGWDKLLSNDWKKTVSEPPVNKAKYWDVMDMSKNSFAEPDALVAWHGKDGYWANAYEDSKDPENCPSWKTVYKGRDLEKIERCKQ